MYGLGLTKDSGIESETALELHQTRPRLIADDRVDVYQQDEFNFSRRASSHFNTNRNSRHYRRDESILDFRGKAAQVQLAVYLEAWPNDKKYDRLGTADDD